MLHGAVRPSSRAFRSQAEVGNQVHDAVASLVVAQLLTADSATVTVAHSRTRDLPDLCRRAEIVVAAVGRPRFVQGDWLKPGATVIDVGINQTEDGLVGDVDFETARAVAGAITPVPGGVGPMTIACLLANTLTATARVHGLPDPQGLTP